MSYPPKHPKNGNRAQGVDWSQADMWPGDTAIVDGKPYIALRNGRLFEVPRWWLMMSPKPRYDFEDAMKLLGLL